MLDGKDILYIYRTLGFENISFNNGILVKMSKREDLQPVKSETSVIILPEAKINSKFNKVLFDSSVSYFKIEKDIVDSEKKLESKITDLEADETFVKEIQC
jgi:hypothetical protein